MLLLACATLATLQLHASADTPSLAGRWTLNRTLSRIPDDVGFGMDMVPPPSAAGSEDAPNNPAMANFRESADDAARREHLVNEVRNPPEELGITQTEESVIISSDGRKPRTFRTDGKESLQTLGVVSAPASGRWNGPRFEIRYKVEQNRELRYEFSRTASPDRLTVEIRFVERNGHDVVTLVYEPTRDDVPSTTKPTPPAAPRPPAAAGAPNLGGLGQAPSLLRPGAQTQAPPPAIAPPPARAPVATGPDAALAGLKRLGIVVEELRPQAAACGLTQAPLEAIVTKAFTDAGFDVTKNSDEDTYVYVDIGTTNVNPTLCVSRYDVYLLTNTVATLSYQAGPALVQVQLAHEGGLAGGAPAPHGESVRANVKRAVDSFVSRIRTASSRK
jgi:hypothetical protein